MKLLYRNGIADNKGITLFDMPALRAPLISQEVLPETNTEENEREAYKKGFEEGEKAGFDLGEQKAAVLAGRIENILTEITDLRKKIIREIEPQCLELAVGIARKIVLRELTANPDDLVEMTKEAMKKLERNGQIVIKINSSLYNLFMKHREGILNIHPDIVFDVDPAAQPFGSVVMSPTEDVITDIDVQLKNLIQEMGERLNGD